ncbi:MAG: hypothetical protein LBB89_00325 [Treponema sp.]|jgi:hypothetical protein|nr:hypothetical protein [Treponema sp.]
MSYERNMLVLLAMPARQEVKNAIIETLFKHNGSIKEFAVGETIVTELADLFSLDLFNNHLNKPVIVYKSTN